MKKINILYYVLCVILMSSCYEDYAKTIIILLLISPLKDR